AAPSRPALAGALVASSRAQQAIQRAAGATAPATVWLSVLPAAAAFGVGWAAWTGVPVVALAAAAGVLAVTWPIAARGLGEATREVAALDAVKLAHVDRVRASVLERAFGRAVRAGIVYAKDVALMRRRYPALYIGAAAVIVAMWFASADAWLAGGGVLLLGAGVRVHGRLLAVPPTERPRLLASLPPLRAMRDKRLHLLWRALATIPIGVAPAV